MQPERLQRAAALKERLNGLAPVAQERRTALVCLVQERTQQTGSRERAVVALYREDAISEGQACALLGWTHWQLLDAA